MEKYRYKSLQRERKEKIKETTVTYYYITSSYEELERKNFDYNKIKFNSYEKIEKT